MKSKVLVAGSAVTLIGLFGVVAAVAVVASQPSHVHVERSISIATPPAHVYTVANDVGEIAQILGSSMGTVINADQPTAGVGASLSWEIPPFASGQLKIEASEVDARVVYGLGITQPEGTDGIMTIAMREAGEYTMVVCSFDLNLGLKGKALWMFGADEQLLGSRLESGLAQLDYRASEFLADQMDREKDLAHDARAVERASESRHLSVGLDQNEAVDMVKRVVAVALPKLDERCYQPRAKVRTDVPRLWTLDFSIVSSGAVTGVRVAPSEDITGDADLQSCLELEVSKWSFERIDMVELPVQKRLTFERRERPSSDPTLP